RQFGETGKLLLGDGACLRPIDAMDAVNGLDVVGGHALLLVRASSTSRSTRRSRCRTQRLPPGSLLSCDSIRPAVTATMQSMSAWRVTPANRMIVVARSSTASASANEAGEGVNPGT